MIGEFDKFINLDNIYKSTQLNKEFFDFQEMVVKNQKILVESFNKMLTEGMVMEALDNWKCKSCTRKNKIQNKKCSKCKTPKGKGFKAIGKKTSLDVPKGKWSCKNCTMFNKSKLKKCRICNTKK